MQPTTRHNDQSSYKKPSIEGGTLIPVIFDKGTRYEQRDQVRTKGPGTNKGTRYEQRDQVRTKGPGTNKGTRYVRQMHSSHSYRWPLQSSHGLWVTCAVPAQDVNCFLHIAMGCHKQREFQQQHFSLHQKRRKHTNVNSTHMYTCSML